MQEMQICHMPREICHSPMPSLPSLPSLDAITMKISACIFCSSLAPFPFSHFPLVKLQCWANPIIHLLLAS